MLVSVKVICVLLILVLLQRMLANAYSPIGLNIGGGGYTIAASIGEVRSGLRKSTLSGRKKLPYRYQESTCVTSSKARAKDQQMQKYVDVVKAQQNKRSLLSAKKKSAGFGAFTSDYRGPMRHPPRNN